MEGKFSSINTHSMIRKDPIFKTLMLSRKGTIDRPGSSDINDPLRFAGEGIQFRAKLIGVLEVNAPRGDRLCQEALGELKMAIKAAGEHKQRILICIALDGLRLRDERTGDCLYHHAVHKISFIAQDMTDPRAFGYIYGSPDQGHRFFGIKTDKQANLVVVAMRDLFQVVYDLKKKDGDKASSHNSHGTDRTNGVSHLAGSSDNLDQIHQIATGGSGRSSDFHQPTIQTADLLNLHSDEASNSTASSRKTRPSFETFDTFGDPFAQAPFSSKFADSAISLPPPPTSILSNSAASVPGNRSVLSPPINTLRSSFTDTFNDSFEDSFVVASGPITNLKIAGPSGAAAALPPPKSPKVKSESCSISHYSTIRPRKKSGANDSFDSNRSGSSLTGTTITIPPPSSSRPASNCGDKSPRAKLTTAIPRPNSSQSTSPRNFDQFEAFGATFSLDSEATAAGPGQQSSNSDKLDIFTELDPLGTGKSRPYVDKKDFFQDLKKPPKKKLLNQFSVAQLDDSDELSLNVTNSASVWPVKNSQNKVTQPDPNTFHEDPFGSLHFVPEPEPDPFDTKFANFAAPSLFTTNFSKMSLTNIPPNPATVPVIPGPTPPPFKAGSTTSHSGSIRLVPTPPPAKSAPSPPPNIASMSLKSAPTPPPVTSGPTFTASSGPTIKSGPTPPPIKSGPTPPPICGPSLVSIKPKSPHLHHQPLRVVLPSQSDSDSELSTLTPRKKSPESRAGPERHQSPLQRQTSSFETVPPLEVRRQSPLAISSSEEDSSSSEEASDRDADVAAETPNFSADEPPQPPPRPPILLPPPLPPKGQPPLLPQRPILTPETELPSADSSPILPLPIPIRKPKMTMGLAERIVPRRISQEESHPPPPPPVHPPKIQRVNKLNQISLGQLSNMSLGELAATLQLPPARLACMTLTELALRLAELNRANDAPEATKVPATEETNRGPDPEDEEPDDEEDAEEVENKADEAEICYKGGKKYEILSNTQDVEENAPVPRQDQVGTSREELGDKYAALREIMEQDLAANHGTESKSDFANFDEMANGSGPSGTGDAAAFGFEDDFASSSPVARRSGSVQLEDKMDDAFSSTGTRPKTPKSVGLPTGNGTSISSGSVDLDPFGDEEFKAASQMVPNDPADRWEEVNEDEPEPYVAQPDRKEDVALDHGTGDEFADRFAAFEARFPVNPLEGFGDSFSDFDTCVGPKIKDKEFADFDSAFGHKPADASSVGVTIKSDVSVKLEPIRSKSPGSKSAQLRLSEPGNNFKKSQSVNIFKRVEDPFDDDFFQDDSASGIDPEAAAATASAAATAPNFGAIVEDPFAWVQPFDERYKFDDEFAS